MRRMLTSAAIILLAGCYHATIETGVAPSAQTISRDWAPGWLFGLVPPSTTETQQRCPNGVARVETQLSFANQLASWLTAYIYTPMSITVTCAEKKP
jgi:Bor protein